MKVLNCKEFDKKNHQSFNNRSIMQLLKNHLWPPKQIQQIDSYKCSALLLRIIVVLVWLLLDGWDCTASPPLIFFTNWARKDSLGKLLQNQLGFLEYPKNQKYHLYSPVNAVKEFNNLFIIIQVTKMVKRYLTLKAQCESCVWDTWKRTAPLLGRNRVNNHKN